MEPLYVGNDSLGNTANGSCVHSGSSSVRNTLTIDVSKINLGFHKQPHIKMSPLKTRSVFLNTWRRVLDRLQASHWSILLQRIDR